MVDPVGKAEPFHVPVVGQGPTLTELLDEVLCLISAVLFRGKAVGRHGPVGEHAMRMHIPGVASGVHGRRMDRHVRDHGIAVDTMGAHERFQHPEVVLEAHLVGKGNDQLLGKPRILPVLDHVHSRPEFPGIIHPLGRMLGRKDAEPLHADLPAVVEGLCVIAMRLGMPIGGRSTGGGHRRLDPLSVAIGKGGREIVALAPADGMEMEVVVAGLHWEGGPFGEQVLGEISCPINTLQIVLPKHSAGMRKCALLWVIKRSPCRVSTLSHLKTRWEYALPAHEAAVTTRCMETDAGVGRLRPRIVPCVEQGRKFFVAVRSLRSLGLVRKEAWMGGCFRGTFTLRETLSPGPSGVSWNMMGRSVY